METVTLTADLIFEEAVGQLEPVESRFDVHRIEARAKRMGEIVGKLADEGLTVERRHDAKRKRTTFMVLRGNAILGCAERWEDYCAAKPGSLAAGYVKPAAMRSQLAACELAALCAEAHDRTGVTG